MSKPAILHIITKLDLGGAQKSCLALVQELQQNYPDFTVYLLSGTKGELVSTTKTLKNVYLIDTMVWELNPRNFWLEIKNFYTIVKIIRQLKIQHSHLIVHTHTIKAGTIGRWAALFAGIKIRIHTIHGFGFNLYQNKLVWLFFYIIELINSLITTHFICVSSQDLQAASEILPNFYQKSSIIRAATLKLNTHTHCQPIQNKHIESTHIFGTIACMKTGKNLFELLKIFKYLKPKFANIKLEIIGNGPLRPAIEKYLVNNNLQSDVILLGWIANPMAYTQKWDGFIFTSLWEGLPCALVEALDLKIPVFSYNTGGLIDLIDKSYLYPQGNWLNLAQSIIDYNTSVNNKQKSIQSRPSPDFYIPKMALDHTLLYKKLLAKQPPFDI